MTAAGAHIWPAMANAETNGETENAPNVGHLGICGSTCGVNNMEGNRWENRDLAPQVGLEPTTLRLTAECSTIELLRSNWSLYLNRAGWRVSNGGPDCCGMSLRTGLLPERLHAGPALGMAQTSCFRPGLFVRE